MADWRLKQRVSSNKRVLGRLWIGLGLEMTSQRVELKSIASMRDTDEHFSNDPRTRTLSGVFGDRRQSTSTDIPENSKGNFQQLRHFYRQIRHEWWFKPTRRLLLLVLYFIIGVAVYTRYENWSVGTAMAFIIVTITTVGRLYIHSLQVSVPNSHVL